MKSLTKTEEEIMKILWEIERGVVRDVISKMPDPKPPYNTISSVVRLLEQKGFVDHKAYGKTHEYFPVISREEYSKHKLKFLVKDYFGGSFESLVSFFVKENNFSDEEVKEMLERINQSDVQNK